MNRLRALPANRRWLLAIVAVALLLRLGWLVLARPEPVSDFAAYRNVAANLLDHGTFGDPEPTAEYLPVLPAFLAVLMVVSRSVFWLGLGMVMISTFNTWLVYLVARELTGRERLALVAAGAYAVSPTFVLFGPVLATEHLFVTLTLTALLLTLRLHGTGRRPYLVAGAVLGIATLARGEALFYLPVFLAVVWLSDRARPTRTRLQLAGVFVAGVVVVVAPWIVRNATQVEGAGLSLTTTSGVNFYFGHNPMSPGSYGWHPDSPLAGLPDPEANRLGWELGVRHLRDDPLSALSSLRTGVQRLYQTPTYVIDWSTREPAAVGTIDFPVKAVRLGGFARWWNGTLAGLYLGLAAAAVLLWRLWPFRLRLVVSGLILFNLIGYAGLLWAKPRFRHFVDVSLTILVALTLLTLWDIGRGESTSDSETREPASPTFASP